jgi:hypothetical protein
MIFHEFKSIGRMSKNCVISEKLDGTNAQIFIAKQEDCKFPADIECSAAFKFFEDYTLAKKDGLLMFAGSRNRWIKLGDDNFGFAYWVSQNAEELFKLGEGTHYGEWVGKGIQRGYGLLEKRFYLFNSARWRDDAIRPSCCYVVPVLYEGIFTTDAVETVMAQLKEHGSYAVPFMNPEGVVVYHIATKTFFKKTFDDAHKGVKTNG